MPNSFQDRIATILREQKADQAELVRVTGRSKGLISQWVNGQAKSMGYEDAKKLNAKYGYALDWLMDGSQPKMEDRKRSRPRGDDVREEVPVVGTVQAGTDGYWNEVDHPVGHGEGFVRYPTKDKNAYALRVKGDSMRPRIKPGEFIVVLPNHNVTPGDEVLVTTKDGRSMVKVLGSRRSGRVELLSINEDHKPITLDESEIEKVHFVGGIIKDNLYRSSL